MRYDVKAAAGNHLSRRARVMRTGAVAALLFMVCAAGSSGAVEKLRRANNDAVERQRAADLARLEKIRKDLRTFMEGINGRLGLDGASRIDDPVDIDSIDTIEKQDHFHSRKKIPQRTYGYAGAGGVELRSEADAGSPVVGRLDFRERVELLNRTDRPDTLGGLSAPWVLVRRVNGDEGWAFGASLRSTEPDGKKEIDRDRAAGDFDVPAIGTITSRYGYRVDPRTKRLHSFHGGIDIAAKTGTPVKASAGGTVVKAGMCSNGYGNLVIIRHDGELATYYGHLSEIRVTAGQRVERGDCIGAVGSTGNATGPHLHFEVRRGGEACDPEAFIR